MALVPLQKIRITGLQSIYNELLGYLFDKKEFHFIENKTASDASTLDLSPVDDALLERALELKGVKKVSNKAVNREELLSEIQADNTNLARTDFALGLLNRTAIALNKEELGVINVSKEEKKRRINAIKPNVEAVLKVCEGAEESLIRTQNELDKNEKELTELSKLHDEKQILADLYSLGVLTDRHYSGLQKTVGEYKITLEHNISTLKTELRNTYEKLEHLLETREDLALLHDYLTDVKRIHELRKQQYQSSWFFSFDGYVPAESYVELHKQLENMYSKQLIVEKINAEEDEPVPTLMRTGGILKPFEIITNMYGAPSKDDIDPTPTLAPFFWFAFGMCLSDVGYGVLLALLGWYLKATKRMGDDMDDAMTLVILCGISAIFGGIITGGWFGITPEQAPNFLLSSSCDMANIANCSFIGQIFNPMSDPISFLIFALSIGGIQISLGLLMGAYKEFKNGNTMAAVCDNLLWFVFLLSILGFAMGDKVGIGMLPWKEITIGVAILVIIAQSRNTNNWLLKPFAGLLGLYNSVGYMSDILSYSRIMALGLSTGVIAFAFNLTSGVLADIVNIPVVSQIIAIVVLLFGHTLNFALSSMGAFIHSSRLQFVEYFSKFYAGGGRVFTPLQRSHTYSHIVE